MERAESGPTTQTWDDVNERLIRVMSLYAYVLGRDELQARVLEAVRNGGDITDGLALLENAEKGAARTALQIHEQVY